MKQDMNNLLIRMCTLLLLIFVSMGVSAKVDVELNKEYKGGKVEVKSQEDNPDGSTLVTITVTPDQGFTITHSDKNQGVIVVAVRPTGSQSGTRAPQIAGDLDVTGPTGTVSYPNSVNYQFTVPAGLNAWVQDVKFQNSGRKTGELEDLGYSGTYYIANGYGYSEGNSQNYYICPTEDWYYFTSASPYYTNEEDNGQPFMTTYQCRNSGYDSKKAVWIVEKQSNGFYHIKRALDGKYLTYNGAMGNNANKGRMRLHIEDTADGDNALFQITYVKGSGSSTIYDINTKNGGPDNASRKYLNVTGNANQGNQPSLQAASTKQDGPNNMNVGGIIGLWTSGTSATDANGSWCLEKAEYQPVINDNHDGTVTISSESGATIYYTIDDTPPTTSTLTSGTSPVLVSSLTEGTEVIKAIAKSNSYALPSSVTIYNLPQCAQPVITVSNGTVTITCSTPGATIRYTDDDTEATLSSTTYQSSFGIGDASVIRAIASKVGYAKSEEAYYIDLITVHSSSEMTNMRGGYILASDFTSSGSIGTFDEPFMGVIDGQMNTIEDLNHPLVAYANNATIKNVKLDNVTISNDNGNAGAICNEAKGSTKIYNCGVLSGSISGKNAGSIVGKLDEYARVINCYSFATVSGSDWGAGIVGYNNFASTTSDLRTMVMNCMFYGDITGGTDKSPIYGGDKITNVGNLNGYNYYLFDDEAPYSKKASNAGGITKYNCALAAEKKYLTRFEFFRNVLNSNRELAAWYATGNPDNGKGEGTACEMAKWVLDTSVKPYPILKSQGYYPSIINYEDAPNLGSISLTISESNTTSGGQAKPTGASINSNYPTTLTVYDKDLTHNHFNYRTVRLPYYNEVGTGNCTHNKVVTGWKITGFTGGTQGNFVKDVLDYSGTTHGENVYPPYNFADRSSYAKDLYIATNGDYSGRIFSQGAYFDVPEGVGGITIEPYWGTAVYLSDPTYDVAYPKGYGDKNVNAVFVSNMGVRYTNGGTTSINGDNQMVYTDYSSAFNQVSSSGTVYDNAIVLVGNYHHYWGQNSPSSTKSFTIMSADLNNDCEPDYSFIVQHGTNRQVISPIRFDFINSPGLGMIQKVETDNAVPSHGIWHPKGWFEVTNTTLIQFTQFEYEDGTTSGHGKADKSPLILLGGIYDQFVTSKGGVANKTEYIHLGSNVWMKEFCNGTHTASGNGHTTRHIPISVTGGEFGSFYLTGTFQPNVTSVTDNAECYISGGMFGETAGSGQEQLKGDVTWLIDHADITKFFGGGINNQKEVTGNIYVEINNSNVGTYCGGPKFGNMHTGKTVTTKANNSTFTDFYGAGYGGTSYFKDMVRDRTGENSWNSWVNTYYKRDYDSNKGIATTYEYEYIPYSGGQSGQALYVGRLYINYASLSLAQTKNVESYLDGCTITGSFYGGGKLGSVDGNVTSTLKDCNVGGNVFGAGYSASVEKVKVLPLNAYMDPQPDYNVSVGVFTEGKVPDGVDYTWTFGNPATAAFDDTNHYIYTTVDLNNLGIVSGMATLNIEGSTSIAGSVYGGGDESAVKKKEGTDSGNTTVNLRGNAQVYGNVFGGGNEGLVDGSATVNIMVPETNNNNNNNGGDNNGGGNNNGG